MKKVPAPNGIDVENISTEPKVNVLKPYIEMWENPQDYARLYFEPTNQKEEL